MRVRLLLVLMLALGATMTSCSSGNVGGLPPDWNAIFNGNPPGGNNNNGGQTTNEIPVTVNTVGGVTTYTWDGGGVQSLTVLRTSAPGTPVWVVATPGRDGITSPFTHGTVPGDAFEVVSTERSLTAGVEYRVTVARIATNNAGWGDFTR